MKMLALFLIALVASASCAPAAKPAAVFGVARTPDGEYVLGNKPYLTVEDCRKSAAKFVAAAGAEGFKLGCASIELE
jgi:hypothetical protein